MPTILDLFDSAKKELYNDELIRIESRGFINPPRGAALLASSPNSLGDLIGGQLAGAIGGTANRPSDTIFKGTGFFRKPITLTAFTEAGLRDAVDADRKYYIKPNPSPASVLNQLAQGGTSARGAATNLAIGALNKYGSPKQLKNLVKNSLNDALDNFLDQDYGTQYQSLKPGSDPLLADKKFSNYKEIYQYGGPLLYKNNNKNEIGKNILTGGHVKTLEVRNKNTYFKWDQGQEYVNKTVSIEDYNIKNKIKEYRDTNQVWVLFQKYGKSTVVPFAGSISGISEDVTPEWTNFRYVGNPFKTYRYQGVERSLKFNLKLYYTTTEEKQSMISKVNYLKSLTFPDDKISEIKYGGSQKSQYAFSPNLVYLSIGDLYNKAFGYIESLSFSIDDNVTWPNADANGNNNGRHFLDTLAGNNRDNTLYPSVIDVSISMKLIENHTTEKVGTVTKYKYDFDGNTYNEDLYKKKIGMKNQPFVITETDKNVEETNPGFFQNT